MNKTFYIGEGGGYYGGSAILTVRATDDKTTYEFRPSGWDFDTESQLEAAALCATSNDSFLKEITDSKLNTLPLVKATEDDIINALFWLTGGNAEWFHGYWTEKGIDWWNNDEVKKLLCDDDDIMNYINDAISQSNNFVELILKLKEAKSSIFICAADVLAELEQYEEDEEE